MQSYLSWYKKPLTQDGLMPLHSFLLCLIVHSKFAWGDLPPPKHVVILDCVLANVFVMFWWVVLGILHTSCSLIFLCPTSSNCSCLAPSLIGRFYWLWTVSTAAHIHNAVSHCSKESKTCPTSTDIMSDILEYPEVTIDHDLSFRSWCQALCLGSQAIRINKESNISKSILVQRKTFASEKCFFLSFDLSLLARFCLSPFAFFCLALQLSHIPQHHEKPLFLLIAVSKGMRVHIGRRSLWPRRRARHCHFKIRENKNIFKQYAKNILVAFKSFACHIYMCNYMWFPHLLK